MKKILALRVDVDTLRGTERGVPKLLEIFAKHGALATFYFSLGPDNMGRHLWRLLKPAFLWKMLRTNATGLYGPEIILMGTAWPGPQIGKRCREQIAATAAAGHEVGFHAWDHHREQSKILNMSEEQLATAIRRGCELLEDITGRAPVSSAAPGWRTTDTVLAAKARFPFAFNSDCRGASPFRPVYGNGKIGALQIPVTMPTYDEALGRDGVTAENYNDRMLGLLQTDRPNVLTVHAEAEGGICAEMFDEFLSRAVERNFELLPLGALAAGYEDAPEGRIELHEFPGREGKLGVQA